jgi:heat-inducible transcriptional repressor
MRQRDEVSKQGAVGSDDELGTRRATILEAVVTEYIGTAQPVGSQHIARMAGVNVSSATVRSEMAALEHDGYLVQPHTSAGRIPTDRGYRFFVDHLAEPGVLGPAERHQVQRFFEQMHGEVEELLEQASGLLSELTSYAAMVVGPSHEATPVRSVQLVGLAPRTALLVVVLSDGAVEKRSVELDRDVSDELLSAAGAQLATQASGRPLSAVGAVAATGDPEVDRVVRAAGTALASLVGDGDEEVFVGGPSRLAVAFDAVETVRSVLSILEQQMVLVSLLRDLLGRGLSVAIGTEHGYEPLASCAVVVAPMMVDGHEAGAVGLLGPTRMNYPQAMAAAHLVGERLGDRISYSLGAGPPSRPAKTGSAGAQRGGDRARS